MTLHPLVSPHWKNSAKKTFILQPIIWPEQDIFPDERLFTKCHGNINVHARNSSVFLEANARLDFGTYFNLFNLGKWQRCCGLRSLGIQLKGQGRLCLRVFSATPQSPPQCLFKQDIELDPEFSTRLPIPLEQFDATKTVLYFELEARTDSFLSFAGWDSTQPPRRAPKLAAVVTTFQREAAIAETVARFGSFAQNTTIAAYIRLLVVDNGQSANVQTTEHIIGFENDNLGGAGGFARGMLEAQNEQATHCLFMDDDAAVRMETIFRTWAFLAYSQDSTAIAGAMSTIHTPSILWENGARFNSVCRPQHNGIDLTCLSDVLDLEFTSTDRQPHDFYGGWWFFAFPLDKIRHLPFPFFVRGDDVSFSLVHDFDIVTLPGVLSRQESFIEKDSPLTWYLDLRSHLAHHLSLPSMDIGRVKTVKIALWFWLRALVLLHYETLSALNLALQDVLAGPSYFADNPELSKRRADIKALRTVEAWSDVKDPSTLRQWLPTHNRFVKYIMKGSLNGLLLPFFGYFGNHIVLPSREKSRVNRVWGAARVTYMNTTGSQSYTVTHSKHRAFAESWKTAKLLWAFWWRYPELKTQWQKAYGPMTSPSFWRSKLNL